MAFYNEAIAALLNNGSKQVLPISMANLIELANDKKNFGESAQSVQDALSYLAGSFDHANTVAKEAQNNAYAYVGSEINNLYNYLKEKAFLKQQFSRDNKLIISLEEKIN